MGKLFSRVREPVICDERLSHIAFIMDGNGRWARRRALPREAGHAEGARNLRRIVTACLTRKIRVITVYAFSTENWRRPQKEIDAIMKLLSSYIDTTYEEREKNRMHIRFIGDLTVLPPEMQTRILRLDAATAGYEYTLNIAVNYGGRQEIVRAINHLLAAGAGEISADDVSSALDTAGQPDPDLVVRTGGECRVSNFLLWQSAYTEYAFSKTCWPGFGEKELDRILKDFYSRQRRFGGL